MLTGQRNFSSVGSLFLSVKILITWPYLQGSKKPEFQLVLWASSSHILLAQDHFLLVLVNDFILEDDLLYLSASSMWRLGGDGAGNWRRACNSSLEFGYLHRKSQCQKLIGGDDISNDIITLGTCFSMFVLCLCWNLTVQLTGSHSRIVGGIQIQRRICKLFFLFLPRHQSAPEILLAG